MASEQDRSRFIEPLPAQPNLQMTAERAKNLLRAAISGHADAHQRIEALHPKPPAPDALKLADTQLVVARGYGFESWAAIRRKIDSLTKTPIEQFRSALRAGDAEGVRALLEAHPEVREAINAPIGAFGGRPVSMVRKNLPVLDVLIEYGADLNLKSEWWAGPFGILEFEITPEEAAPLIARGATADIFAAAYLGMADRVRELVEADPSLVRARGGDGRTALHCARTVEIAQYLIDRGARSMRGMSITNRLPPNTWCARRRTWRGSSSIAGHGTHLHRRRAARRRAGRALPAERSRGTRPSHLAGKYTTVHKGRPSTPEEIGDHRGDIYRWVFDHNVSVVDAARMLGFDGMVALLLRHASPTQRLLAACAAADRQAADTVVAEHPSVIASLTPIR